MNQQRGRQPERGPKVSAEEAAAAAERFLVLPVLDGRVAVDKHPL